MTSRRGNQGLALAWVGLAALLVRTAGGREGVSSIAAIFAYSALTWVISSILLLVQCIIATLFPLLPRPSDPPNP